MSDIRDKGLPGIAPENYGGDFEGHLLEQYKLYVASADNLSARRVSSNNFLLTLNTGIVALYGIGAAFDGAEYWINSIPFAGLLAAAVWFAMIWSYRKLNTVKFEIIRDIEKGLPLRIYAHEWHVARKGDSKAYLPVSMIERWIPVLYGALHIAILGVRTVNWIF